MVPRDPLERTLHSATLRPLGEATAYAGSLTPALRGIDLPGRGRGSSERMGRKPREDPPQIRERILREDGKETTGGSTTDQGEDPPGMQGRTLRGDGMGTTGGPSEGFHDYSQLENQGKSRVFFREKPPFFPEKNGFFRKKRVVFPRKRPKKRIARQRNGGQPPFFHHSN